LKNSLLIDPSELEILSRQAVQFINHHLLTVGEGPVRPVELDVRRLRALLDEPLPVQSQGIQSALQDFIDKVAANSIRVGHPRFLAWIRTSPAAVAVYAEALAAAINQSVAVWDGAPAATEVELRVIEWLKAMAGYNPAAGGLLTSGGSMANFICLLAARSAADPLVRQRGLASQPPFTIYITAETHYCIIKAAEMMGLGRQNVRLVDTDPDLRMDPARLADAIHQDRQTGYRPMAVVTTLGTVNSGACDDLEQIGRSCRAEGVWWHVDGAYGGRAGLVPEKRSLVNGIETVDSLAFDPHKSLFMPFEAGCALVRDPALLRAAFAVEADYLPNSEPSRPEEMFNFRDYGPQLSRNFRALKIYLTLKAYGTKAIADQIGFQYQLASQLGARIRSDPEVELLAPIPLGMIVFRYRGRAHHLQKDRLDEINGQIVEISQRRGKIFLAGTRLRGRYGLRACFVSYRTTQDDLDVILDEVRELGRQITREKSE